MIGRHLRRRPALPLTLLVPAVALAACGPQPAARPATQASTAAQLPSGAPTPNASPPAGASGAVALQDAYEAVVRKVLPSVVQIETTSGLGSGVVFDVSGDIVTNNHVVAGATSFTVTTSSAKKYQATLVGAFPADDLAVIHVDHAALVPVPFADSNALQVGEIVMAIGNPLGFQSSVTAGIVSATGRTVSEQNGVVLPDTIQTSAQINPGNSGGALVDLNANVVGIPTLAAIDQQLGGSAQGIGFAIPSSIVKSIASQLVSQGHVTHSGRAYMGVRVAVATFGGGTGALVASVDTGSPADKAGIMGGDTITALNGQTVATPDDLSSVLASLSPGDTVKVQVTRQDGSQQTLSVTLGELPS